MKTAIFNIWTETVEEFIKSISTDGTTYDVLSQWMDERGAKLFQLGQKEHFEKHRMEYIENNNNHHHLPNVRIDLASEQVVNGFENVFTKLSQQFPDLENVIDQKRTSFIANLLNDSKYHSFFAVRAVETAFLVKRNSNDKLGNLHSTLESFKFLKKACDASIKAILDYRDTIFSTLALSNSIFFLENSAETKGEDVGLLQDFKRKK